MSLQQHRLAKGQGGGGPAPPGDQGARGPAPPLPPPGYILLNIYDIGGVINIRPVQPFETVKVIKGYTFK